MGYHTKYAAEPDAFYNVSPVYILSSKVHSMDDGHASEDSDSPDSGSLALPLPASGTHRDKQGE